MAAHIIANHYSGTTARSLACRRKTVAAYTELVHCEQCPFKHWTVEGMAGHVERRHCDRELLVPLTGAELLRLSQQTHEMAITSPDSDGSVEVTKLWNWSPEVDDRNDRIDLALAQQAAAGARKRHPAPDSSTEDRIRRQVARADYSLPGARTWSAVAKAVNECVQVRPQPEQAEVKLQVVMNPGLFTGLQMEITLKCDVFQEADGVRSCACTKWVGSMYFSCELPVGKICRYGTSVANFTGKFCVYGHPGARGGSRRIDSPLIDEDAVYRGEVLRVQGIFEVEFVLAMRVPPTPGTWYVWESGELLGTVVVRNQQLPIFGI